LLGSSIVQCVANEVPELILRELIAPNKRTIRSWAFEAGRQIKHCEVGAHDAAQALVYSGPPRIQVTVGERRMQNPRCCFELAEIAG
jgi:hypothetical protein